MLNKEQKATAVDTLADQLKRKKVAIFSDFRGTSVSQFQSLRRALKKEDADFKVAKKTLFDRALEKAGFSLRTKDLEGEIGVTFGYGDETAPAKILSKFRKKNEHFTILAGILNQRILSREEVLTLAKLPSRDILIGQLLGVLQSPLRGLVTVLQGNMRNLVVVLNKIKDNK